MAKISIEFDTETKGMSVFKDGVKIENVVEVCAFKGYSEKDEDKFTIRVSSMTENEDETITYMTVSASEGNKINRVSSIQDKFDKHYKGVF